MPSHHGHFTSLRLPPDIETTVPVPRHGEQGSPDSGARASPLVCDSSATGGEPSRSTGAGRLLYLMAS